VNQGHQRHLRKRHLVVSISTLAIFSDLRAAVSGLLCVWPAAIIATPADNSAIALDCTLHHL
jgi:hypothetical protein